MSDEEGLTEAQLARVSGGVSMQLTQFGYRDDPYMDSNTKRGLGAYHHLVRNESVALTDSSLSSLGLTRAMVLRQHPWVDIKLRGGGTLHRRIDDRAPERNRRADLYMVDGFDRRMPDYADVTLAGDGGPPVASHDPVSPPAPHDTTSHGTASHHRGQTLSHHADPMASHHASSHHAPSHHAVSHHATPHYASHHHASPYSASPYFGSPYFASQHRAPVRDYAARYAPSRNRHMTFRLGPFVFSF